MEPGQYLFHYHQSTKHAYDHFIVGFPVEDPRLTTLPAYHHLSA
jgi:hypothetical protein